MWINRKKSILFFIGFLGIFGILAGLFYISFKLENLKEPLIVFLKSQISGNLSIEEAKVSFFPPGLNLKNISLFAPGETTPSATVEQAKLRFHYIPVLQDNIQTTLWIDHPRVQFYRQANGQANMETIFAPLLKGEAQDSKSAFSKLWRKKLEVDRIRIRQGNFFINLGNPDQKTELRNLNLRADEIQFNLNTPAQIQIQFVVPTLSSEPLQFRFPLVLEKGRELQIKDGRFSWNKLNANFGGEFLLPNATQKDPQLNLQAQALALDLQTLSFLKGFPPVKGKVDLTAKITGSVFAPITHLELQSSALQVDGKKLTDLKFSLLKQEEPLEIEKGFFRLYGGTVESSGKLFLGALSSAKLKVQLGGLSLGEISGDKTQRARLNANLDVENKNLNNSSGWTGAGTVNLGPFPIPPMDLSQKVRVAEILTLATNLNEKINIGMLKSSSNVVGTQIDQIHANISFAGDTVNISSFNLGNSHFTASGSGTLVQQKRINASGVAVLSSSVTAQLFPDQNFRSALTEGKGTFSVPFRISGELPDPDVIVDQDALKQIIHRATLLTVKEVLLGGVRPQNLIDAAIQKSPLGKIFKKQDPNTPPPQNQPPPKNPLQELLFGR